MMGAGYEHSVAGRLQQASTFQQSMAAHMHQAQKPFTPTDGNVPHLPSHWRSKMTKAVKVDTELPMNLSDCSPK